MMQEQLTYPVIDLPATGRTILELRKARGLTVRDIQTFLGFENPQAIYKWQRGEGLPSLDNLVALSRFLQVPMDDLIVLKASPSTHHAEAPQANACGALLLAGYLPCSRTRKTTAILALAAGGNGGFAASAG